MAKQERRRDLNALLSRDPRAWAMLDQLPQGKREKLLGEAESVSSLTALENCIHSALREE